MRPDPSTAAPPREEAPPYPERIGVVDTHTEGEPTRVIVDGWPELQSDTQRERREELRSEWDHLRRAVVCEPRGHDAVVGALLTPPVSPDAHLGLVFFNNVGYLGMCGHGLIGVARALEYLGRLPAREFQADTPVGRVSARVEDDGSVTIRNPPALCHKLDVALDVPGVGRVTGDIAYGGNWFFMTGDPAGGITADRIPELRQLTKRILAALDAEGIQGADGARIDHVWLSSPSPTPEVDARNFVLCPGGAYDRSPCGTGTSAHLAVLHERGRLEPGEPWRQESVMGGVFTGWLEAGDGALHSRIRGRAWVTSESTLILQADDPLRSGFPSAPGSDPS